MFYNYNSNDNNNATSDPNDAVSNNDPLILLLLQNISELKAMFTKEPNSDGEEGMITRSVSELGLGNTDGYAMERSMRNGESIATTLVAAAASPSTYLQDGLHSGNARNNSPLPHNDSASSMSMSQSIVSSRQQQSVITPTVILCRLTGFMIKKGNLFPSWKRRYFVLDSRRLTYYASIEDANQQKPLSAPFVFFTGEDATTISDKGKTSLVSLLISYLKMTLLTSFALNSSSSSSPPPSSSAFFLLPQKLTLRNHGINGTSSRKKLPLKFDSQEEKAMWKRAFLEHCTSDEMLSMKGSKPREQKS